MQKDVIYGGECALRNTPEPPDAFQHDGKRVPSSVKWIGLNRTEDQKLVLVGLVKVGDYQRFSINVPGDDGYAVLAKMKEHLVTVELSKQAAAMEDEEVGQQLASIWAFGQAMSEYLASNCPVCQPLSSLDQQIYVKQWELIFHTTGSGFKLTGIRIEWMWIPILKLLQQKQQQPVEMTRDFMCNLSLAVGYLSRALEHKDIKKFNIFHHRLFFSGQLEQLRGDQDQCFTMSAKLPTTLVENFNVSAGYPFLTYINPYSILPKSSTDFSLELKPVAENPRECQTHKIVIF
ncbi:hypothetical protein Ciccas_014142 [Cichlidogyrus casuarinus]|uniref:Uncharacterized protein n=1 Tax=Cichlidogyrus casuarinus TaxID=1844966 RepID=A0ABD2PJZ1_9PLAT